MTARPRPEIGYRLIDALPVAVYSLEKDAVAAHDVVGKQGCRKRIVASQIAAIGQIDDDQDDTQDQRAQPASAARRRL